MTKCNFTMPVCGTNLRVMFVPRRQRWMPVATLTGLAACLTLAADSPSNPLLKMRGAWREQVQKDTQKLRTDYAARLAQLEKELAAAGDYHGAVKARREKNKIAGSTGGSETTAPTIPSAVEEGQPINLEAPAALLNGGVKYDAARGVLSGWSAAGAAASWLLPPGLKAGGYDVELTWACAADSGGDFILKEDRYHLRRTVKATTGWDTCQTEIIGPLRLLANSKLLELSAAAVKGADLLHLKSIRLLPAAGRK